MINNAWAALVAALSFKNMMPFKQYSILCFLQAAILVSCHAQKKVVDVVNETAAIAFPGAEGFGKNTTGGRGGKIFVVTNLNDTGPGSFREAAEGKGPRIIVFAISGTIHLDKSISIKANATIGGQTAPGDGICIAD